MGAPRGLNVLVEDRSHFRYMTIGMATMTAKRLHEAVTDAWNYHHCHGRITKRDEKRIRGELNDLRRSLELLDQVGWR